MSRLAWTRRLGVTVVGLTFVLMVLGGWVKANGAGLACPDWPACYGEWLPPFPSSETEGTLPGFQGTAGGDPADDYTHAMVMYEWTHRLVASLLGPPMLAFAFLALAGKSFHPGLRFLPAAGILILGIQFGIGGGTVLTGNPAWFTTLHLATATLFVITMTVAVAFAFLRPYPQAVAPAAAQGGAPPSPAPPKPQFGFVYKDEA